MTPVDQFRLEVLGNLTKIKSFSQSWPVWLPEIEKRCKSGEQAREIFMLGGALSDIFSSNSSGGRGQSDVSAGGAAWECLITWYLNLVFWGTNIIATKQNKLFVPPIITKALTVTIANHQTNTESDIVVYSVPEAVQDEKLNLSKINRLIAADTKKCQIAVVQCKTNWNDNSQIPMLWDLIYNSSRDIKIPNVSIGIEGVTPASFEKFSYAFATVPSNKRGSNSPESVRVLRVCNLSGGNYWGKPTLAGVASSISEYFQRNFPKAFGSSVQNHIQDELVNHPEVLDMFVNLRFK